MRDRGSLSPVRTLGQHCAKWLTGYGYHCFYAFLWLAGLFTVTALTAVFWLGPDKYIVAAPAAGTPAPAAASPRGQPGRGQPVAAVTPAASANPSASATPSANHRRRPPRRPTLRAGHPRRPTIRGLRPSRGTARPARRAATAAATRQCSDPARIGYAIELAFPVINLNSSLAAQCDVPASGAAAGVVVFGWAVRAAAATLLALYTLGLTGVTRSPPGAG